jgi:hypothetical protein
MNNLFKRHYQFTIFILAPANILLPLSTQASVGQAVSCEAVRICGSALYRGGLL